jgi:hypothetical protein
MAARSINHKFIRLFDQSIPENHADYALVHHFIQQISYITDSS